MSSEDPLVLYIVVRKGLGMSIGKTSAQVGHGVCNVMEQYAEALVVDEVSGAKSSLASAVNTWLDTDRIICVKGANEKDWPKIRELPGACVAVDRGLTEVPADTETVISFAPMRKSVAPKALVRLQLLKDSHADG